MTLTNQSRSLIIGLFFILLTSCTVTFLAPYDEITDTRTAELQEKILLNLNKWNTIYEINSDSVVLKYSQNLDFYNEIITGGELLLSRNQGVDKNRIVTKQLEGLLENLNEMKSIHQEDVILDPINIQSFKTIFSTQLGAIQKYQQVRKESNTTN